MPKTHPCLTQDRKSQSPETDPTNTMIFRCITFCLTAIIVFNGWCMSTPGIVETKVDLPAQPTDSAPSTQNLTEPRRLPTPIQQPAFENAAAESKEVVAQRITESKIQLAGFEDTAAIMGQPVWGQPSPSFHSLPGNQSIPAQSPADMLRSLPKPPLPIRLEGSHSLPTAAIPNLAYPSNDGSGVWGGSSATRNTVPTIEPLQPLRLPRPEKKSLMDGPLLSSPKLVPGAQQTMANLQELPAPAAGFTPTPAFDPSPVQTFQTPYSYGPNVWVKGEFLGWFLEGDRTPPLVTSSPAGTPGNIAGQLGQPTTSVLFGGNNVDEFVPGARLTLGLRLNPNFSTRAWEAEAFGFNFDSSTTFAGDGTGDILARPFFNTDPAVNGQDTQIFNMNGLASGETAFTTSASIFSVAPRMRRNLCNQCFSLGNPNSFSNWRGPTYTSQVDFLAGYRFLRLEEEFAAHEMLTPMGGSFTGDTLIELSDSIRTKNDFHGGEFGLNWFGTGGNWTAESAFLVALGAIRQEYGLSGVSTASVSGVTTTTNSGGFHVRPENVGTFTRTKFTAIPQIRLNLGYRLTQRLRAHVGYDLLYIFNTVRPGSLISTRFDGRTLGRDPGAVTPVDPNPADTDIWAHGFNLGLTLNY